MDAVLETEMTRTLLGTTGARLRELRKAHGVNQKELAAAVSRRTNVPLTDAHISTIETNRRNPSVAVLKAIAEELNVSTDYLLMLTNTPRRSDSNMAAAAPPVACFSQKANEAAQVIDGMPDRWQAVALDVVRAVAMHALNDPIKS